MDRRRFLLRRGILGRGLPAVMLIVAVARVATAAELVLLPHDTNVRFTLGATLHTVEGTAPLLRGSLRFDPAGGPAEGRIVIDATRVDTDNDLRDASLHEDVLESGRYPEIVFVPQTLEVIERGALEASIVLLGRVAIHGGEHALRIPAVVRVEGERLRVEAAFTIPFVAWGLRDPSNFLLSVEKEVRVSVEALVARPPLDELGGAAVD